MHLDITTLTALAVFLHLGTALARTLLKDRTDQVKIDKIDAGVTQVLGTATAIAAVLQPAPASAPAPTPAPSPAQALTDALTAAGLTLAPAAQGTAPAAVGFSGGVTNAG